MNISNAQDMYTSLSDRLFNRKEKKLCHPNQFTLLNRLCLHFGSLQMPLFRSRFLSMFYNRGAVDKFGKRLTKTNCHYPILVNVFKFALKECSLSVSLWSFTFTWVTRSRSFIAQQLVACRSTGHASYSKNLPNN